MTHSRLLIMCQQHTTRFPCPGDFCRCLPTVGEKDQVAISRFEVPRFVYNHVAEAPPHKLGVMLFAPLATLRNPSMHTAQTADRIICLQSFSWDASSSYYNISPLYFFQCNAPVTCWRPFSTLVLAYLWFITKLNQMGYFEHFCSATMSPQSSSHSFYSRSNQLGCPLIILSSVSLPTAVTHLYDMLC